MLDSITITVIIEFPHYDLDGRKFWSQIYIKDVYIC